MPFFLFACFGSYITRYFDLTTAKFLGGIPFSQFFEYFVENCEGDSHKDWD